MGKKGNSHLKSITCSVLLTFLTSSPSWGGTAPIHHPRGSFSEPQSEQKCHQDNKILLSRPFHRERGQQLPGVYHLLSLPDLSYPILLLGCSSPIHNPRGPFQSPKVTKNAIKIIRSCLAGHFLGEKGENHLKSITCSVLLIFITSFPSWGSASPIHHPRAPIQSPKMTKNAIKITRSCLAGLFIGNEGNNYLETITCQVFLIFPTPSPSWCGTSPIHHPRGLFQSPKVTKMQPR